MSEARNHDDQLEKILRDARYEAPSGLAGRLAARARDREAGRVLFWSDVERLSRSLFGKAAAAAVLAAGLALAVALGATPDNTPVVSNVETADADITLDQVARLTVAPRAVDRIVLDEQQDASSQEGR